MSSCASVWTLEDGGWRDLLQAPPPASPELQAEEVPWEVHARGPAWRGPSDGWLAGMLMADDLPDPGAELGLLPPPRAAQALGRDVPPALARERWLAFPGLLDPGEREAWERLRALLGQGPGPHTALPWFLPPRWPRDGHRLGLLDPAQVQALAGALERCGLFGRLRVWHEAASAQPAPWSLAALTRLEQLVLAAGKGAPAWLLAVEGIG